MKVLYFHQHFGTPEGSTGTRSYEFARALLSRGHRVTMVCGASDRNGLDLPYDPPRKWSRGTVDGIDVIALPLPYSNHDGLLRRSVAFLRFAWRSVGRALREDYDVLFATSTPLTAGIPGIVMRLSGRGKPFVFEVRDLWPELPRALGLRNPWLLGGMSLLEWASYRAANACIGLSPGIVDGIRRRSPRGREVVMVPNGCDLELFTPGPPDSRVIEGVPAGNFVAGFMGAHGIANGLDAVLDAAADLQRRGRSDITLLLIGDGREKPRLHCRAQELGLTQCRFLAPMKKRELAKLTVRMDCGLMILADVPAFYRGTSPNKFFDYLSAGLPVVCNYPGWLAEMINREGCGLAVPPQDAEKLADALCYLADNRAQAREMGRRSRQLAERDFDRRFLAARLVEVLEKVT